MRLSHRRHRAILLAASALLCLYAAWRLSNLVADIRSQGMIPQLWEPLITITLEVGLLLLCIGLLATQSGKAKWAGFAHAGLWLVLLLISLPIHVPLALNAKPVPLGHFSQAALSQRVLTFDLVMLVLASLLAWGIAAYSARSSGRAG